jgi:hypothetical protein
LPPRNLPFTLAAVFTPIVQFFHALLMAHPVFGLNLFH